MKPFIHKYEKGRKPVTMNGDTIEEAGFILPANDWNDAGTFEDGRRMISSLMKTGGNPENYYQSVKADPTTPQDFINGMEAAFKERDESKKKFHIVDGGNPKTEP